MYKRSWKRFALTGSDKDLTFWAAVAGLAGPPLWIMAALVSGLQREDYSFAAQPISDLGIGPNAWILNAGLIGTGLLVVVFALGFGHVLPHLPRRRLAIGMLITFGVCFAAAGVFPESDPEGRMTIGGILHFVLGFFIGMTAMTVALFVISSRLRRHSGWGGHARYTRLSAWLMVGLIFLTQLFFNPGSRCSSSASEG